MSFWDGCSTSLRCYWCSNRKKWANCKLILVELRYACMLMLNCSESCQRIKKARKAVDRKHEIISREETPQQLREEKGFFPHLLLYMILVASSFSSWKNWLDTCGWRWMGCGYIYVQVLEIPVTLICWQCQSKYAAYILAYALNGHWSHSFLSTVLNIHQKQFELILEMKKDACYRSGLGPWVFPPSFPRKVLWIWLSNGWFNNFKK